MAYRHTLLCGNACRRGRWLRWTARASLTVLGLWLSACVDKTPAGSDSGGIASSLPAGPSPSATAPGSLTPGSTATGAEPAAAAGLGEQGPPPAGLAPV